MGQVGNALALEWLEIVVNIGELVVEVDISDNTWSGKTLVGSNKSEILSSKPLWPPLSFFLSKKNRDLELPGLLCFSLTWRRLRYWSPIRQNIMAIRAFRVRCVLDSPTIAMAAYEYHGFELWRFGVSMVKYGKVLLPRFVAFAGLQEPFLGGKQKVLFQCFDNICSRSGSWW